MANTKLGFNYKWTNYGSILYFQEARNIELEYMKELRSYGFTKIRPHVPDYQSTGVGIGDVTRDKYLSTLAKQAGFLDVSYGMSSNSFNNITYKITNNNWASFRNACLTDSGDGYNMGHAEWAKRNNINTFVMGNEEMLHAYFSTSGAHGQATITRVGTTATVTLNQSGATHNYANGQQVTVSGASPSQYNGTFTITSTGTNTFTYTMASDPGASASGGFVIFDRSATQFVSDIKTLAADIKSLWSGVPGTNPRLMYCLSADSGGMGENELTRWIADGKGTDIDVLGINIYGAGSLSTFNTYAQNAWSAFGTGSVVTEFAVHQTWASTSVSGLTPSSADKNTFYREYSRAIEERISLLDKIGFQEYYYFIYNGSSDQWSVKLVKDSSGDMQSGFVPGGHAPFFYKQAQSRGVTGAIYN